MPESKEPVSGPLPATVSRREGLLHSFEAAWQRGERPQIDGLLTPTDASDSGLLFDLIGMDLEYRLKAGEVARVEDYLRRYPTLKEGGPRLLEIIVREFTCRRALRPSLMAAEYLRRFPQHAAQLRTL
jgi:hypothetical protein